MKTIGDNLPCVPPGCVGPFPLYILEVSDVIPDMAQPAHPPVRLAAEPPVFTSFSV